MTDINKQIEEYTIDDFERMAMETDYAIEASEDTCKINEADAGAFFAEGLKHGVKLMQHSSRWRKVSDGLPEFGDIVVAKGDSFDFQDMYLIEIDSDYSMSVLTSYYKEWKPMD